MAPPSSAASSLATPVPADGLSTLVTLTKAAADELRARVLRILKDESYGVLELCRILDAAQPALSHHLKVLYQAELVSKRREGNTVFYRRAPVHSDLQQALLDALDTVDLDPLHDQRIDQVHAARSRTSEAFFAEHAEQFAGNQARICEAAVYAASVIDAVERLGLGNGTALDIGPGDGELLAMLAGRFERVVGVDSAREMLDRCAARLGPLGNVELLHRDVADLDGPQRYELVVAAMVVHHQPSPRRFFQQARRLLGEGGVFVVAELCRHDHEWARAACGDLWLGFEPGELTQWAGNAGLHCIESQFLAQKNGFRVQIHTYQDNPR